MVNFNPFNSANPMTIKDAGIVAAVLTLVILAVSFFDPWTYEAIAADPGNFCFELFKTAVKTFGGAFVGLAGLEEAYKRAKGESVEPG